MWRIHAVGPMPATRDPPALLLTAAGESSHCAVTQFSAQARSGCSKGRQWNQSGAGGWNQGCAVFCQGTRWHLVLPIYRGWQRRRCTPEPLWIQVWILWQTLQSHILVITVFVLHLWQIKVSWLECLDFDSHHVRHLKVGRTNLQFSGILCQDKMCSADAGYNNTSESWHVFNVATIRTGSYINRSIIRAQRNNRLQPSIVHYQQSREDYSNDWLR